MTSLSSSAANFAIFLKYHTRCTGTPTTEADSPTHCSPFALMLKKNLIRNTLRNVFQKKHTSAEELSWDVVMLLSHSFLFLDIGQHSTVETSLLVGPSE